MNIPVTFLTDLLLGNMGRHTDNGARLEGNPFFSDPGFALPVGVKDQFPMFILVLGVPHEGFGEKPDSKEFGHGIKQAKISFLSIILLILSMEKEEKNGILYTRFN